MGHWETHFFSPPWGLGYGTHELQRRRSVGGPQFYRSPFGRARDDTRKWLNALRRELASSGAVFMLGFLKVGRESFGCVALRVLVILFDQFGNPVLEIGRLHDFTNMPCRNNDCDSRICAEPILFRRIWRGR